VIAFSSSDPEEFDFFPKSDVGANSEQGKTPKRPVFCEVAVIGSIQDLNSAWSQESPTAAVMPRYHIEFAIKRALGARLGTLKGKVSP
jgi:hypothetical protein